MQRCFYWYLSHKNSNLVIKILYQVEVDSSIVEPICMFYFDHHCTSESNVVLTTFNDQQFMRKPKNIFVRINNNLQIYERNVVASAIFNIKAIQTLKKICMYAYFGCGTKLTKQKKPYRKHINNIYLFSIFTKTTKYNITPQEKVSSVV